MPGPYLISDPSLLTTLPGNDAVVPEVDRGYGIQCVGLVKYYSACGGTGAWKEGDLVSDSPTLERGTAIATFDENGRYRSAASGNHACFFIAFMPSNQGITVLEQHVFPHPDKIQTRNIIYRDGRGDPSNDANAYSVIL